MARSLSPEGRIAVAAAAVASLVAAVLLTRTIPAVEGLGEKVRLPIFHGGSTWVNLAMFTIMGLFALAYLVTRREDLYRWVAGFRGVSAAMWVINTVLGVVAAIQTWDFSGSKEAPLAVIREDPRLMAQFQLVALLLVVLIIDAMIESRYARALLDVAFATTMWVWLGTVLSSPQARALHPDNPVLNSGSEIQLPFFAIVGCVFLGACLLSWLVRDRIVRAD